MASRSRDSISDTLGGGQTILVAANDDSVRDIVAASVRLAGYTTITFTDGTECLDHYREQENGALIIAERLMPRTNGLELARALRGKTRAESVPVILLSSRSDKDAKAAAFDHGASTFMKKPFSPTALAERIDARLS